MSNIISTESFTQGFSFSYSGGGQNIATSPANTQSEGTQVKTAEVSSAKRDSAGKSNVTPRLVQEQVLGSQRRELRSQGKKLLNFRFFSGGLQNGPGNSESPSMNALIVAGSEGGTNDIEFKLLNVTSTGQAREIYSSTNLERMQEKLQSTGLDLRGMLLDRQI
ncbi:MAG: hypothetical protein ACQEP7_06240 [bacterium]